VGVAGDIVANLTANTSQWTSAFTSALTPLNAFSAGVTAALGLVTRDFIATGSQLQDMSDRTGITANSLSELAFVAGQTDTSLESLQSGIVKMNKFLADVRDGGKESGDVLASLGTTIDEVGRLTPDQQLELFADRLSQIEDVGERGTVAMKIFGKGAVDLIPLLNTGGDGIRSMRDEAEALGATMSDQAASDAEELGDSIDKVSAAVKGATNEFISGFAPILITAAEGIASIVADNGEWITILGATGAAIVVLVGAFKLVNAALSIWAQRQAIITALSGPKGLLLLAAGAAAAAVAVGVMNAGFAAQDAELAKAIESNLSLIHI
jgi:hypothetical protein